MNKNTLLTLLATALISACNPEPTSNNQGDDKPNDEMPAPVPSRSTGHSVQPIEPQPVTVGDGKQMENLDRGLVAVKTADGVFLSWRMLGTDTDRVGFNLYRNGNKINTSPIAGATNFSNQGADGTGLYTVRAVIDGKEATATKEVPTWGQQVLTVDLDRPSATPIPNGGSYSYSPGDASVGDVDGDGEYEIILKWDPSNQLDSSQCGYTGNVLIDAYKLNGQRLWRVDLGRNIRAGAHDTQFMVYDFDGDGKAELAVRTSDGSRDSQGTVIGNAAGDHHDGCHVSQGPEFLTMFNGETGVAMASTAYPNVRGAKEDWGGTTGRAHNRSNRFLAGVAYINGKTPSMIWARGYYDYGNNGQTKIAAVDWRDGRFDVVWKFFASKQENINRQYIYQGAHSLSIGDVDNDGRDEIIYGAATIDDDGTGLYSTNLCHGDALHVADIVPSNPGLEIFMVHESGDCYGNQGVEVHDGATGTILYAVTGSGDNGRGVAGDVDPRHEGMEVFAANRALLTANGESLSLGSQGGVPSSNFMAWWDGDLLREGMSGREITKWNYNQRSNSTIFNIASYGGDSNNGSKATPSLQADILGDWREEVIWRNTNNRQLLIATTTIPTEHRIRTLMHDAQYRVAIAWQNTAYNQPPHPGFFLGNGMSTAPKPNIYLAGVSPEPEEPKTEQEPILEIEEGTGYCSVDGLLESNNAGFNGEGFSNAENIQGSSITWAVDATEEKDHALTIRYAGTSNRPASVFVNNVEVNTAVEFPTTGAWTTWRSLTINSPLSKGNNVIKLVAQSAEGLANIDGIKVWHTGAEAGICPSM